MTGQEATKSWYEESYKKSGFAAQRFYPNEELLRFFGRFYFPTEREKRSEIRALEMGCGSGANLWMIAREGFDAYGVDLSSNAVDLCENMLRRWDVSATLNVASMNDCPYESVFFDVIVDVFSSYCLDEKGFEQFLDEVARLLKPGGRFFSYAPSKASDAFRNPGAATFIDRSTLNGIRRETSAYFGNDYPFRFIDHDEYENALAGRGLKVSYSELVGRTYNSRSEYFEFVVIAAEK